MQRMPLSFGIEIECCIGTLLPGQLHPDPNETRFAHFPKTTHSSPGQNRTWEDVADHIRKTFANAGFQVEATPSYPLEETHLNQHEVNDLYEKWEIGTDSSIRGPQQKDGYKTVGIEIRSPAFYFTPSALSEIGRAVDLLRNQYQININRSCGTHVHCGNGLKGLPFWVMQRLLAFLWAFEPQLNSLHPQGRFNTPYACSMRYGSHYSETFLTEHGRRPKPFEGVAHFLQCKDWDALSASCEPGARSLSRLAYRFADLKEFDETGNTVGLKLTIEFRQHAASVDKEEILNWIRTCVGIVEFVKDSHILALDRLFSVIEEETYDGGDGATREPVLAETGFTIAHLLEWIGLEEPRKYYGRMGKYRIRKGPDILTKSEEQWQHNQWKIREEMEALQNAASQAATSGFSYDPHDTTGMQDWESNADCVAGDESFPISDDVADVSSSGIFSQGQGGIDREISLNLNSEQGTSVVQGTATCSHQQIEQQPRTRSQRLCKMTTSLPPLLLTSPRSAEIATAEQDFSTLIDSALTVTVAEHEILGGSASFPALTKFFDIDADGALRCLPHSFKPESHAVPDITEDRNRIMMVSRQFTASGEGKISRKLQREADT